MVMELGHLHQRDEAGSALGDRRILRAEAEVLLEADDAEHLGRTILQLIAREGGGADDLAVGWLRAIAAHLPLVVVVTDHEGAVTDAFGGALARIGMQGGDLVGVPARAWGVEVEEATRRALDGETSITRFEGEALGRSFAFRVLLAPLPQGRGVVSVAVDVSDAVEVGHALSESEARFRLLAESAPIAILLVDVAHSPTFANPEVERQSGYSLAQLQHQGLLAVVHPDDRPRVEASMARLERGSGTVQDYRLVRPDGSVCWVRGRSAPISAEGGLRVGYVTTWVDITTHRIYEEALNHRATHDDLTGLANRRELAAVLDRRLALGRPDESEPAPPDTSAAVSVLFVAIDGVREATHLEGHRVGDAVVAELAGRLEAAVGSVPVARFDASEFVVVLDPDVDEPATVARRVAQQLAVPVVVGNGTVEFGLHIGIATAARGGDPERLLADADLAMAHGRVAGQTVVEFDDSLRREVAERRRAEASIRRGIAAGEFTLHYQPIVELVSGRVRGFEALARWDHPHRGVITASAFIEPTERAGLVGTLGEQLLDEACTQLAAWQHAHPGADVHVAVNLSGGQIANTTTMDRIEAAIQRAGADPTGLIVEITESVLLADLTAAATALRRLTGLGARVAIDDFGTGFSSLTYLCRLPVDMVKIDRSFVQALGSHIRDASIAPAVVGLARSLALDAVAEGIESEEHRRALVALGCPLGQGFLFAPAMPAVEAGELIGQVLPRP
jgi:PAS domain S-box-containing protein/diguanylate cyclase (GGDEF)-like protein